MSITMIYQYQQLLCREYTTVNNKTVLDVFTGLPGKIHDDHVLKLLYVLDLLPNWCNEKYYLLGDEA